MDPNAKSKCCGVKITEPHKPNCPIIKINKEVLGEVEKDETMRHILKLQIAIAKVLLGLDGDRAKFELSKRVDVVQKFLDNE